MYSLKLYLTGIFRSLVVTALLVGFVGCDIESPALVKMGSPVISTALRLPAKKISQNESVKLAKAQSTRFGVEPAMILGVITQESGFNAHAISPVGALGMMQLMPATVKHINNSSPVSIKTALNPGQNIAGGTWYLRSLYNQFKAYPEIQRWQFALASYNGGIGRVSAAIQKVAKLKNKPTKQVSWIEISPYLPAETRNYVPAVMSHTQYYRRFIKKV